MHFQSCHLWRKKNNRIGEQQHYNGSTTHYNNTFQHLLGVKVKGGSKPSKGIRHVPVTNRNKSCRSLSCMVSKPVQKRCTIGSVSTNRPLYLTPALYVQQNKRCEMKALKAPNHQAQNNNRTHPTHSSNIPQRFRINGIFPIDQGL